MITTRKLTIFSLAIIIYATLSLGLLEFIDTLQTKFSEASFTKEWSLKEIHNQSPYYPYLIAAVVNFIIGPALLVIILSSIIARQSKKWLEPLYPPITFFAANIIINVPVILSLVGYEATGYALIVVTHATIVFLICLIVNFFQKRFRQKN